MPVHVAILRRPYLDLILAGRKTIESRLTQTAMPPFGAIVPGERVFLKVSAGPFMATALATHVECHDGLTPAKVDSLRRRLDTAVCGGHAYWHSKRFSRYATFVTLGEVEPIDVGPAYPKSMKAWHVVDERLSPLREFKVTAGALRNNYALLPGPLSPGRPPFTLVLPDGREVRTQIARGHMIRWRGWGQYYREHGVRVGDRVRFVNVAPRRLRVMINGCAGA
jgi:hypothetical protein